MNVLGSALGAIPEHFYGNIDATLLARWVSLSDLAVQSKATAYFDITSAQMSGGLSLFENISLRLKRLRKNVENTKKAMIQVDSCGMHL